LRSWALRFWAWFVSLRPSLLAFADTFASVIVGHNVLRTAALSDTIAELQLSMVRAVDEVRESVTTSVRHALIDEQAKQPKKDQDSPDQVDDSAVRVNISVLSPDGASVSYISSARGSLARPFQRQSVAWVAVASGQARGWIRACHDHAARIVLHENKEQKLVDGPGPLLLRDYFQARASHDYEAFIVIPVPRRAQNGGYSKAGVHISFSD